MSAPSKFKVGDIVRLSDQYAGIHPNGVITEHVSRRPDDDDLYVDIYHVQFVDTLQKYEDSQLQCIVPADVVRMLITAAAEMRRTSKVLSIVSIGGTVSPNSHYERGCDEKADTIINFLLGCGLGNELDQCGIS